MSQKSKELEKWKPFETHLKPIWNPFETHMKPRSFKVFFSVEGMYLCIGSEIARLIADSVSKGLLSSIVQFKKFPRSLKWKWQHLWNIKILWTCSFNAIQNYSQRTNIRRARRCRMNLKLTKKPKRTKRPKKGSMYSNCKLIEMSWSLLLSLKDNTQ